MEGCRRSETWSRNHLYTLDIAPYQARFALKTSFLRFSVSPSCGRVPILGCRRHFRIDYLIGIHLWLGNLKSRCKYKEQTLLGPLFGHFYVMASSFDDHTFFAENVAMPSRVSCNSWTIGVTPNPEDLRLLVCILYLLCHRMRLLIPGTCKMNFWWRRWP